MTHVYFDISKYYRQSSELIPTKGEERLIKRDSFRPYKAVFAVPFLREL